MNFNQLILGFVTFIAIVCAVTFSAIVAEADYFRAVVATLGVIGITWIVIGYKFWWLPIPFAIIAGGVFQTIFKIYPYELALAAAVVAILPAVMLSIGAFERGRARLPWSVLLLFGYLALHWAASLAYNRYIGLEGAGNVTRAYGAALWVVIFIILFHRFGKIEQLRAAFWLMFAALLLRLGSGLYADFTRQMFIVPIVNYIPAGPLSLIDGAGAQDLRFSGLYLAGLTLAAVPVVKWRFAKVLLLFGFIASFPVVLLGGGRAAVVMWFFYPVIFCLIQRRIALLATFAAISISGVAFLNINPESLRVLPFFAQRSASILIIEPGRSSAQEIALQSNLFHERFSEEGYNRWTQNIGTIVFGTGIRPAEKGFDLGRSYGAGTFEVWLEAMVTTAANTGAYEKGLWTVLAVTGLAGLLLYLNLFRWMFWYVGKNLWRYRIRSYGDAFGYLGIVASLIWLMLSWQVGSYPSFEIFCLYLGYQYIADKAATSKEAESDLEQKALA